MYQLQHEYESSLQDQGVLCPNGDISVASGSLACHIRVWPVRLPIVALYGQSGHARL